MFRLILVAVLATVLGGCQTLSVNLGQSAKAPEWYLNPPPDTPEALYGLGERRTLELAKSAALSDVAGKLGTQIKSQLTLTQSRMGDRTRDAMSEEINAAVANTEITHFELVNSAQGGLGYRVLVKVDKAKMADELQVRIAELQAEINHKFNAVAKYSDLAKLKAGSTIEPQLAELKAKASTLRAISPGMDNGPLLKALAGYEAKIESARSRLVVMVKHDSSSKIFAQKLEALLSEKRIKVVSSGGSRGKTVIDLASEVEYFDTLGDMHARLRMVIRSIDDRGKVIATRNEQQSGYSRSSKQAALEQANYKLAEQYTSQGVFTALGI